MARPAGDYPADYARRSEAQLGRGKRLQRRFPSGLFCGGRHFTLLMRQFFSTKGSSALRCRLAGKTEFMQRAVQNAGMIAGKWPSGAVGAGMPGARPTIRNRRGVAETGTGSA
jgi:hypothetical protein